ncbi:luciferase family oxidoreductase, group 1 family protein [Asticcacaulis biprosthecium C19]|uniref:Luciferase-like monooxygenase n=1 Tax=Asticcacaulis biprosthecium C19 TaxID=715226 RepID=F4QSQ3_9CAUL|nr:LLM class flavin-dependent oxidoreductase [Asticcacaulis biprosthecium]EGF89773.1 luciferase family oxidoreductase, group 1 family protein [Asticcacaulis biprosthecium C19]
MIPFSILDLSQISEGGTVSDALANSARMAQAAEAAGYHRYWLAEHHGMPAIASAATAIVIAHVGQATKTIRIGSGGIMLPNHSPLVIAEQFGTLEALFPGRVDLGLGRAPGTDMMTARALRRNMDSGVDSFPNDVVELQALMDAPDENQRILAVPGMNAKVPIWLLGSSLYSAQLAAQLGLPYAFASHFAPELLFEALHIYRSRFQPSEHLEKPHTVVGVMGVAADSDAEAEFLYTSMQQSFANLRRNVRKPFPKPSYDAIADLSPEESAMIDHMLRYAMVGSSATIAKRLTAFLDQTQADELIISMPIHDIEARLRSLELFAALQPKLRAAA